jgi:hypothetical protein
MTTKEISRKLAERSPEWQEVDTFFKLRKANLNKMIETLNQLERDYESKTLIANNR